MLNKAILDPDVSEFIKKNRKKDLPGLILKGSPFEKVSIQEIAIQIKGLNTAEKKHPDLYATEGIIYPPKINLEQTSSEVTAKYKASLISGNSLIDLTGGLGIDSFFLSKTFENLTYCEINPELAEIARHNFKMMDASNISVKTENSLEYLKRKNTQFDWIYIDPARRDEHGEKVFKLGDCDPDIRCNLDLLFQKSQRILLKTSPVLDISAGLKDLECIKEIHIVAIKNEVKELLWIFEKSFEGNPVIKTVNFEKKETQYFSEKRSHLKEKQNFSDPKKFLFEPNSAIMKSGLFNELSEQTNTEKLHKNSHLYTSDSLIYFPGRKFQVVDIKPYKPSYIKKYFKSKKANITTRNFSESVEEIRKKFKIKDGGEDYVFFTTNLYEEKIVVFCKKV